MDEIVTRAMLKWPDVPHCYSWLALDARGNWRMRNERVQALGLRGDTISNPALLGFIARNYACDEKGCWYFQNGPQRVYINLASTPYIAHTDPIQGFVLHTGEPIPLLDSAWMTEEGILIIEGNGKVAQIDDRDMADVLPLLRLNGRLFDEDELIAWMSDTDGTSKLTLETASRRVPVQRLDSHEVEKHFGFNATPCQT